MSSACFRKLSALLVTLHLQRRAYSFIRGQSMLHIPRVRWETHLGNAPMRIALLILLLLASSGDLVHAQVTRNEQVCSTDPFTRTQTCVSESYQAKPPSPPPPLTRNEIQEMERRDSAWRDYCRPQTERPVWGRALPLCQSRMRIRLFGAQATRADEFAESNPSASVLRGIYRRSPLVEAHLQAVYSSIGLG